MDPLWWSILLLVVALALVVMELFVPSGGVLGFLAAVAVIASLVFAFMGGPKLGFAVLLAVTILVPSVIASAVRWWPNTPIGRLILIARPEHPDDVLPDNEEYRGLKSLIGRVGRARTKMLPSGDVTIDGRTYDALSQGRPIEKGDMVKVLHVRTHRLVVRAVTSETELASEQANEDPSDVLSRPVQSLGLDGLDEPLS